MNRRCFPRFPTRIEAQLTLLEEPSITVSATICDISEGGLQIQIDRSFRIGAPIRLEAEAVTLYGQVQYCCPRLGDYMVGVSGDGIQIDGNELTCSVEDLLAYWDSVATYVRAG